MATKQTTKLVATKEPKKWIFGELLDNGEVDFVMEDLLTEEQFIESQYEAGTLYFRIDPIHIEKIKIETKIVKA